MALVNLDLIGPFAISQAYEWRLSIYHPGDVVQALLWGQIWGGYEPDSRLAQFSFEQAIYDPTRDLTKFPTVLNAFTTGNLEATGSGFYVYEVRLSLPFKNPQPILAGRVHVLPSLKALEP